MRLAFALGLLAAGCVALNLARAATGDDAVNVSPGQADGAGLLVHEVTSPLQAGTTHIRVLLPKKFEADRRYPVVYVLPVEAGGEHRYGDGLAEVQRRGLADSHGAVFVAPTFSHLPWYADHATDPTIRQETYLLEVVLPCVERTYPVLAEPRGRLLLGFSKSGWGAWSLLLRHPDVFGRAAAWDAPMMLDHSGPYGSGAIFGTDANFERYHVARLVRKRADDLRRQSRLILTGYGNFRPEHARMHDLLDELRIPHEYRDGPAREHDWHSGWVSEAVELLLPPPAGESRR